MNLCGEFLEHALNFLFTASHVNQTDLLEPSFNHFSTACFGSIQHKVVQTFSISISCEVFVIFVMPTQNKYASHIRSAGQIYYWLTNARKPNNSRKHQLINLQTHQLINSQTRQFINTSAHQITSSQAHQLTNPPTQNLKIIYFVLQNLSGFHFVLARILAIK